MGDADDIKQTNNLKDEFLAMDDTVDTKDSRVNYEEMIEHELEKINQEQQKKAVNNSFLNSQNQLLEDVIEPVSQVTNEGVKDKRLLTVNSPAQPPKQLSEQILSSGLKINDSQTAEALDDKIKQIDEQRYEEQVKLTATNLGLPYINLKGLPIMPEALEIIDEAEARQKKIICFLYREGREIRVAAVEYNQETIKIINKLKEQYSSCEVKLFLTSPHSLKAALDLYKSLPKVVERVEDDVEISGEYVEQAAQNLDDLKKLADKFIHISASEALALILAAAIKTEASDIHIEAGEEDVELRFRIDGVLHKVAYLDKALWSKLSSRIKLKAGLKINVADKPQDGNFSVKISNHPIDFRVSTLPTTYGESVVMRVLYHDKVKKMTLDNLGLTSYNRRIIEDEIHRPNGLIVVTGPTGSGKTTTLYAILNKLNTPQNKIITIEDPVEYKIHGINQSEINESKGYTFAKALRSIVRQDPDIILVGEIRDKETVEIALNAALTGHLVFTTLHTNNAIGAIARLLSLGAKSYLLSPALNISLAQRLVRKLCVNCRQEILLNEEQKELIRRELENLPEAYKAELKLDLNMEQFKIYKARGCNQCAGLGYHGQIGLFEIFQVTDQIRELISTDNISETKLNDLARENGMVSMRQDGILKVLQGITSLDEVLRVT